MPAQMPQHPGASLSLPAVSAKLRAVVLPDGASVALQEVGRFHGGKSRQHRWQRQLGEALLPRVGPVCATLEGRERAQGHLKGGGTFTNALHVGSATLHMLSTAFLATHLSVTGCCECHVTPFKLT